jgi:alpha-beta hydrolase superfamily lysophospholipase
VHVHGLAGNFYENRFVYAIAQRAIDSGIGFLTFNNRGHDYISDVNREGTSGVDSVRAGAAFEKFSDCVHDIDAAVALLIARGITTTFLQGHSTGANKVAFYCDTARHDAVKGIALISPCDDIALQHDSVQGRAAEVLNRAAELVAQGNSEAMMPDGSFYNYPMSASTFYDLFRDGADQDVFPYRLPSGGFEAVSRIDVPIFVSFGKKSDGLLIPADEACRILKEKAVSSPSVTCKLIDEASHSYLGQEYALADEVIAWVMQQLRGGGHA